MTQTAAADGVGACFELRAWTEAEFRVLCKAMAALGPAVRKVLLVDELEAGGSSFLATEFAAALPSCTGLEELSVAG